MSSKIVIVHYINTPTSEAFLSAVEILEKKLKSEEIIPYFIRTQGETRIECINPRLISEDEYTEARKVLEKAHRISKEVSDSFQKMAKTYPNDSELGTKVREISNK